MHLRNPQNNVLNFSILLFTNKNKFLLNNMFISNKQVFATVVCLIIYEIFAWLGDFAPLSFLYHCFTGTVIYTQCSLHLWVSYIQKSEKSVDTIFVKFRFCAFFGSKIRQIWKIKLLPFSCWKCLSYAISIIFLP